MDTDENQTKTPSLDEDVIAQFRALSDACHDLSEAFIRFSTAFYAVGRRLEQLQEDQPDLFSNN